MKSRFAAPLILAFVFHAVLLLVLLFLRTHGGETAQGETTEVAQPSAAYGVLYEASSNLEFAYNVQNNNFTPIAILGNATLTLLPLAWAARVFMLLSAVALVAALWLLWKAVLGSHSGWVTDPPSRSLLIPMLLLVLVSAPMFQVLYSGSIDCFVVLLIASAIFLGNSSREVAAGEHFPVLRRNLDLLAGVALAGAVGLNPACVILLVPLLILKLWRVLIGTFAGTVLIVAASPKLWSTFWLVHVPGTAELFYRARANASITSALHLFARTSAHQLIPYSVPPVAFAGLLGLALLLLNIHADSYRLADASSADAAPAQRAAQMLTYVPFVLAVPFVVEPSALVLNVMLLPAFLLLQREAATRTARIGLDLAVLGWALTQSHVASAGLFRDALFPAAISGLGTLVLLTGLCIFKWPAHASAAPRDYLKRFGIGLRPLDALLCQIAGGILIVMACARYYRWGCTSSVLAMWSASIVFFFVSFSPSQNRWKSHLLRRDLLVCAGLVAVFAAPYLAGLYNYPVQVNTDELIQLSVAERLVAEGHDWFGIDVSYFLFPKGGFLVIGQLGRLLGGITFEHVRQACGFISLAAIPIAYIFYRQFLAWRYALAGAAMLGCSHVLFGLSRAVCRENLPVVLELLALTVFVMAWRRRSSRLMFLGGIISGLGVYSYYSARTIAWAWIAYLSVRFLLQRTQRESRTYLKWAAIAALGFAVSSAPMYTETSKIPPGEQKYLRNQIVIYPEGRDFVRNWENTDNVFLALARNTGRGLTMFNNGAQDHANIYNNPGCGIVDPVTGVLLWLGVGAIVRRRKWRLGDTGVLTFLFVIWIPYSFLLSKNPGYSRNLILLPYVFYLSLIGARAGVAWLAKFIAVPGRKFRNGLFAALILFICAWNGWIYYSYIVRGRDAGDAVGSTMRYVEALSRRSELSFFVVMDNDYPYYWFGGDSWKPWTAIFAGPHPVELVASKPFLDNTALLEEYKKPCVILMSGQLYQKCSGHLKALYPNATAKNITASGDQMAVELLEARP